MTSQMLVKINSVTNNFNFKQILNFKFIKESLNNVKISTK